MLVARKRNHDSLTRLPQQTRQVAKIAIRCRRGQRKVVEERQKRGQALHWSSLSHPLSGCRLALESNTSPTTQRTVASTCQQNSRCSVSPSCLHVSAGLLPVSTRWITCTHPCWQREKNGKPRPIKIGEFLRSASASGEHLPDHLASQRAGHATVGDQSGWCLRGQCHWRGTTESLIHGGVLEPVVAGDLDLVNLFVSAQWLFVWRARRLFSPSSARMSPSSFLIRTSWTRSSATFAFLSAPPLSDLPDHCWRLTIHQGDVMWHGLSHTSVRVSFLSPARRSVNTGSAIIYFGCGKTVSFRWVRAVKRL